MHKDRYKHAREAGYRSGLEVSIANQLKKMGISFEYEPFKIPFIQPAKRRTYTPDYLLPNGIVIESKGRLDSSDRQKHKMLQAQHPELDLRFVFSNSRTRISKQSKTTYGMWCETLGFTYADKMIPQAWIEEPTNKASLAAIKEILGGEADEKIKETMKTLQKIYTGVVG